MENYRWKKGLNGVVLVTNGYEYDHVYKTLALPCAASETKAKDFYC